MISKLTLAAAVAVTPFVHAQTYLTTPPTGTEVEGGASTFIFGWAPKVTQRFMDFSHAGKSRTIKAVSFRLDGRDHVAIGRTWSNVKLRIGHGDWSSIRYNKSKDFKLVDKPVTVFDKQWSFPALKGRPPLKPASWGGVRNSLMFRFSKPWVYNGKDAIFLEFEFGGGTAHNNQKWETQTPKGFEYFLDSMPQAAWRGEGATETIPPKAKPCGDSAFGNTKLGATLFASIRVGPKVELGLKSYYTSPTGPVVYAVGIAGNRAGTDVGAGCHRFYVDLANPMVVLILPPPNNKAAFATTTVRLDRAAWMKEFWSQAAWIDSKTRRVKLTPAQRVSVAAPGKLVPAATSYQTGGVFNVWTSAPKGMPFIRYDV